MIFRIFGRRYREQSNLAVVEPVAHGLHCKIGRAIAVLALQMALRVGNENGHANRDRPKGQILHCMKSFEGILFRIAAANGLNAGHPFLEFRDIRGERRAGPFHDVTEKHQPESVIESMLPQVAGEARDVILHGADHVPHGSSLVNNEHNVDGNPVLAIHEIERKNGSLYSIFENSHVLLFQLSNELISAVRGGENHAHLRKAGDIDVFDNDTYAALRGLKIHSLRSIAKLLNTTSTLGKNRTAKKRENKNGEKSRAHI